MRLPTVIGRKLFPLYHEAEAQPIFALAIFRVVAQGQNRICAKFHFHSLDVCPGDARGGFGAESNADLRGPAHKGLSRLDQPAGGRPGDGRGGGGIRHISICVSLASGGH